MTSISRFSRRGIRRRVLLINGAFFAGTAVCLAGLFFLQARATLMREFDKRGVALTGLAASETWMALTHEHPPLHEVTPSTLHSHDGPESRLGDQLDAIVRDEDVRYILVLDAAGNPAGYASNPRIAMEEVLRQVDSGPLYAPTRLRSGGFQEMNDPLYGFGTPVCAGHHPPVDPESFDPQHHASCELLATVWIGLSPERTLNQVNRAFLTSLLAGLVFGALGLVAIFFLSRVILKPIAAMAAAARAVAQGDLTRRVEIDAEDEIGELAHAFNEMTWSLADSQAEVARRNEDLQLIASEKERLYQNAQSRATRLEVMNELAKGIASSLDPKEIFENVHRQLSRLMGYEYFTVERWIPELKKLRRDWIWLDRPNDAVREGQLVSIDGSPVRKVQQTRMPLSIPEFEREPALAEGWLAKAGFRSGFIVPIVAGDEFLGALGLASRRRNAFARVEVATVFAVADTLAVVLKNVDLYRRLEQSYIELQDTQKRLAQSENVRRAEKLRSVGQMASGIAHNFNNVLSAIIGRVQVLKLNAEKSRLDRDEVLRCLDVIERASLDGSETVRRLQEFSRGHREVDVERADLNDLVHSVIEITRPRWKDQAEQQGVHIRLETKLSSVASVACVPGEMREVLTNLIFNAVDAMPEGGTLTIETAQDGVAAVLTVRDTGTGMSPEVREHAFDPFYTTKGVQGTGLGLSTVYGIVERHNGSIQLTSEPGAGTEFVIRLPVAEATTRKARSEDMMGSQPWRILIGDDEPNVRDAMADLLRILGHTVTLASSGEETVKRFREGEYDLVFTDLGMPDLSGWEVAKAIREMDPQIPIVLATGWGAEINDETARERGITRVLAKPFTVQKLSSLIAEMQQLRRAA